jgi:hypothetical protein
MSGNHGYKAIMPWTGFRNEKGDWVPRGGSRFIPNEGKTMHVKQKLPLHRAKVWASTDASMELVVLQYEDQYDARVDIYRFQKGVVQKKVMKFNKSAGTTPSADRFAVLMKAEGEKCFVRFSWKQTKPASAVDFDLTDDVLTRWRGSLALREGKTTQVDW